MAGTPGRSGRFLPALTVTGRHVQLVCPDWVTAPARVKWDELAGQLNPEVLEAIDSHAVALLATLLAEVEQLARMAANNPENLPIKRSLVQVAQSFNRMSALFGLTPADRARVKAPKNDGPDPFAEFIKQGTKAN